MPGKNRDARSSPCAASSQPTLRVFHVLHDGSICVWLRVDIGQDRVFEGLRASGVPESVLCGCLSVFVLLLKARSPLPPAGSARRIGGVNVTSGVLERRATSTRHTATKAKIHTVVSSRWQPSSLVRLLLLSLKNMDHFHQFHFLAWNRAHQQH